MGLPEVVINFNSAAATVIQRSAQGIVALILRDDTLPTDTEPTWAASTAYAVGKYVIPTAGANGLAFKCTTGGNSAATEPTWPATSGATVDDGTVVWTAVTISATKTYGTIDDVSSSDWTATNYGYLKNTFLGGPHQVITVRGKTSDADYSTQLSKLGILRWNWLSVPGIASADVSAISTWIISQRNSKKTYKAILPNSASDNEGIVNFTTTGIQVGTTNHTTAEYCCRIAGILAGLPLTQSATYYVLTEVTSITQSTDPDTDINAGKLILYNDGEKIKIARGVNSLQTIAAPKSADWQKIKIIEGHDIVTDDVVNTFSDDYVGKVPNDYDNQAIFISAVNAYLDQIEGSVLDPNGTNSVDVDIAAQRQAWQSAGTDTSSWTDQQVKTQAFQSKVFLAGSMKFLDAMEDLQFNVLV